MTRVLNICLTKLCSLLHSSAFPQAIQAIALLQTGNMTTNTFLVEGEDLKERK